MSEIREISGHPNGAGRRIGIVASRFNGAIVEALLKGALAGLSEQGVEPAEVTVVRVPGAWEIPQALEELAAHGEFAALIALGALIRGETAHYELICAECAAGVARVASAHRTPVAFGVLACDTLAQAEERAGGAEGNKGFEAAMAALEMGDLVARLRARA
jgi:6,7-dimethyl-8-ribityllumazine synthase